MQRLSRMMIGLPVGLALSAVNCLAEEAGHEGAKPKLIEFQPETAIWVLVIFVLLLVILYPTAWKGVLKGLKTREERIRKDIADAEAARQKAQDTLAEYNTQLASAEDRVRDMLAKAQADGQRLADSIRENAGKEAEGIKSKALADIEDARKGAVAEIHRQTAELSTAIAEKIIRRNLNVEDQRALVQASLQELDARRN